MTAKLSSRALWAPLLACALGACTGRISALGAGGATPAPGAMGAAGAGGGTTGAGGATVIPFGTDPGRVTIHRLNRAEYNNTVRDLLGTTMRPADAFPPDDLGLGFDNIADVLSLSPVHLSLYQSAAEALVTEALAGAARAKLVTCDIEGTGATCARSVLRAFGRSAWRRPVTDAEIDHLMTVVMVARANADTWEAGLSLALQSMLVSPNFLFRVELDPSPTSLTPHALTSYEIAARLSYFLWSSMPDAALAAAADAGVLGDKAQLATQVTRMLADPKASALVDNFAGQWLYTRLVDDVAPDATMFPQFDAPLRDALKQETTLMFQDVIFKGVPADQLLLANYTYANDRLAQHYALPAGTVTGTAMQKVTLPAGSHRGGFLTQGSFLTVTSHPTSTSPVLRGKWILGQLLCQDVAPPPNAAMAELAPPATGAPQTLRQRLEQHHMNPCAVCHVVMDPLGFGLENYDAVGQYRTTDNGLPVDATGMLPDGRTFNGAAELESVIAKDPGFASCVTQKLYTYALGRGPDDSTPNHMDPATLQRDADAFRAAGYPMAELVTAIVTGDTFLERRGDATPAPAASTTGGSP
jgi:Protein of unknown function (DUF1592)/Protein of unknown function (DUF1588)/Protein of unknown function (DUF1587)/Protein of unknown function (DUF1595)/Protein of unknown function (DUF1585)